LYPICHGFARYYENLGGWVDLIAHSMHFWDPMLNRYPCTGFRALESAAMSLAGSMTFTTIIITTTRTRGASG
jgi:hypothetical protein